LDGGSPVKLYGSGARARWSGDGKMLFITMERAKTYVLPLAPGRMLPAVPVGGFKSEAEIAALPGVRVIADSMYIAPGRSPDVYAFTRESIQRNLYRIPLP
jgi:hypothetical protein